MSVFYYNLINYTAASTHRCPQEEKETDFNETDTVNVNNAVIEKNNNFKSTIRFKFTNVTSYLDCCNVSSFCRKEQGTFAFFQKNIICLFEREMPFYYSSATFPKVKCCQAWLVKTFRCFSGC